MEWPGGWTLLTSSLSVADLSDSNRTWRFLVAQGLVNDSDDGSRQLGDAIAMETARGRITGGTLAFRVAEHLRALALPPSDSPDPFGKLAARRWESFTSQIDERAV